MNKIATDIVRFVILPFINDREYWYLREIYRNFYEAVDAIMREYFIVQTKIVDKEQRFYLIYYYKTHIPRKFINFDGMDIRDYEYAINMEYARLASIRSKFSPPFSVLFPTFRDLILCYKSVVSIKQMYEIFNPRCNFERYFISVDEYDGISSSDLCDLKDTSAAELTYLITILDAYLSQLLDTIDAKYLIILCERSCGSIPGGIEYIQFVKSILQDENAAKKIICCDHDVLTNDQTQVI